MIAFRWICPSAWWPLLIGITKDLTVRVGEKKLRSQRNSFIKCWRQNVSMNKIPLCSSLTTIFSYLLFSSSFEKLDNYNLRKHSVKSPFFLECENTRGPSHAQYSEGSAVPRGTLHMRRWKWYQQSTSLFININSWYLPTFNQHCHTINQRLTFRFRNFCQFFEGFGFGKCGFGKQSLGIGFGQDFGIVIQCYQHLTFWCCLKSGRHKESSMLRFRPFHCSFNTIW